MFDNLRSRWRRRNADKDRRRATDAGEAVYVRAAQQINRMAEQGTFGTTEGLLLNGEVELLSLTSEAASITEADYRRKIGSLADQRADLQRTIATVRVELDQSDTRKHLVRESKHTKDATRVMTVPEISERVDELTEQIDAETADGSTRHRQHVSRFWRGAAKGLLVIDVAALFVLMLTIENTSFTKLFREPEQHVVKFVTALAFSLLAAAVLAIAAHSLGQALYRRIHRLGGGEGQSKGGATLGADHNRVLIAASVIIVGIAVVVGISMYQRIIVAAGNSAAAQLAGIVGAVIGFCAVVTPALVAWVTAQEASPEVAFRASLSRVIAEQNRRDEALVKRLTALQLQLDAVDDKAARTLHDAERALQQAMLPATQLILRLRTDFGHAGEVYTAILLPALTEQPAAIAFAGLERLRHSYLPRVSAADEPRGPHAINQAA